MSEQDSLVDRGDVGDVVGDHVRLKQSDPPVCGSPTRQSSNTPGDADGVNSLLTPLSEESPIADSFPPDDHQVNGSNKRATPQAKVAIPRDTHKSTPLATGRVLRACSSCRSRKVKCSGQQPACRQCRELNLSCRYPMSWREEMKREVDSHSAVVKDYQDFVRELLRTADLPMSRWINATLRKYQISEDSSIELGPSSCTTEDDAQPVRSMPNEQSQMLVDQTNIAIGPLYGDYLHDEGVRQTATPPFPDYGEREVHLKQFTNAPGGDFASAIDYCTVDAAPIQKYGLPSRNSADNLFNDYITEIHPEFPIINKPLFVAQYLNLWDRLQQPGDKWLAILNMMFAISSLHIHRMRPQWNDPDYNHLLYFARAKLLSMTESDFFSHPDLQQMQVEGLTAFYLLASEQFDKAWRISALVARSAVTLSSNLKITNNTNLSLREARFRLWWCVYTFEQVLGLISSRPTSIAYEKESVPLPLPVTTESNSEAVADAFFVHSCKLAVLVEEVGSKFSRLSTWPERGAVARDLLRRIDGWRNNLPSYLDFSQLDMVQGTQHKEKLAFHYHGVRIALGSPWLFSGETIEYDDTSYEMAHIALGSAKEILAFLPEECASRSNTNKMCPWWCVLHYTTEATKAIFLELLLGCVHLQDEQENLIRLASLSIHYFKAMSLRSARAYSAWEYFSALYRNLCLQTGYNTNNTSSITDIVSPFELCINHGGLAFYDRGELDSFKFYGDIGL